MPDASTPNLPSRSFDATEEFYHALRFRTTYRSEHWMILVRGTMQLEFFPWPDLDPFQSSFGCCLRLDALDEFMAEIQLAGVPNTTHGFPRYTHPEVESSGLTIGYLLDPDGSLLRLIQNEHL